MFEVKKNHPYIVGKRTIIVRATPNDNNTGTPCNWFIVEVRDYNSQYSHYSTFMRTATKSDLRKLLDLPSSARFSY